MEYSVKDLARILHLEALRQAVHELGEIGITDKDGTQIDPAVVMEIRFILANKYDKLARKYGFDTPEILSDTVESQYVIHNLQ